MTAPPQVSRDHLIAAINDLTWRYPNDMPSLADALLHFYRIEGKFLDPETLDAIRPTELLDLFVPGRPAPQGSKNARPIYKGRGQDRQFTGRVAQVESSTAVAPWRTDIRHATIGERVQQEAVAGPMLVRLDFVMPRPTSTSKRRTPAAVKRPDLDKLIRAVLDAVGSAGCVWLDDSQVVDLHATKRIAELGEAPGCRITIHTPAGQP